MNWLKKNYKVIIIFLILVWLVPEIYLYPVFLLVIKPAGEEEINEILLQVDEVNNTFEKLEMIAEWEAKDFTNAYNRAPTLILDPFFRYPVYLEGNVKVRASAPLIPELSNNPYWDCLFQGRCLW
ncbi:MAG: hypothetical protein H5T46_04590 [Archaeoglobi archaeon]|nr:hypothetical protein [Candidatus Mnemosynella sp.]